MSGLNRSRDSRAKAAKRKQGKEPKRYAQTTVYDTPNKKTGRQVWVPEVGVDEVRGPRNPQTGEGDESPSSSVAAPPRELQAMLGTNRLPIYDQTEEKADSITHSNLFVTKAHYPNRQAHGSIQSKHPVAPAAVSDPDTRFNPKRKIRPSLGWSSIDDGPASKMARKF